MVGDDSSSFYGRDDDRRFSQLTFNCYELLEIDRDASTAQVKRASHAMTVKHHPDGVHFPSEKIEAEMMMKKLNECEEILLDGNLRKAYNAFLNRNESDIDDIEEGFFKAQFRSKPPSEKRRKKEETSAGEASTKKPKVLNIPKCGRCHFPFVMPKPKDGKVPRVALATRAIRKGWIYWCTTCDKEEMRMGNGMYTKKRDSPL